MTECFYDDDIPSSLGVVLHRRYLGVGHVLLQLPESVLRGGTGSCVAKLGLYSFQLLVQLLQILE